MRLFKILSLLVIVSGSYFMFNEHFSKNRKEHQTTQLAAQLPLSNSDSEIKQNLTDHTAAPIQKAKVEFLPNATENQMSQANLAIEKQPEIVNRTMLTQEAQSPERVEEVFDNLVNDSYSSEAQRELALSTIPEVVGEELSEQEAKGLQTLTPEVLEKMANGRMFPDQPKNLSAINNLDI